MRPTGTREMWERLPESSEETGYQAPPIDYTQVAKPVKPPQTQTRSLSNTRAYVPQNIQRVGLGADQV